MCKIINEIQGKYGTNKEYEKNIKIITMDNK